MLYLEVLTKAVIEVKAWLSEKCKIQKLSLAQQFLRIEIQPKEIGSGISLSPKAFVTTFLKWFNIENPHHISTLINPNVTLDLAEDLGENEPSNIKVYQASVSSLLNTPLAIRPDILLPVAVLRQYNGRHFTSYLTTAKRVLQCLKSTANFRLHFSSSSSTGSHDQLIGYIDLDWANDSADCKSQGGHVFHLSKFSSPGQTMMSNTLLLPKASAKWNWCFRSTEIHMAKMHCCSWWIATIRVHLVLSAQGSKMLTQNIWTFAITIVQIYIPSR